jgi:hypothetical protein
MKKITRKLTVAKDNIPLMGTPDIAGNSRFIDTRPVKGPGTTKKKPKPRGVGGRDQVYEKCPFCGDNVRNLPTHNKMIHSGRKPDDPGMPPAQGL